MIQKMVQISHANSDLVFIDFDYRGEDVKKLSLIVHKSGAEEICLMSHSDTV